MKNEGKKEKKLFFFFCPHTLTFRLKRPVYRGFSGEGKCEGKLSTLTLTFTPSWISLATVRSVSLRLQNESQKNSRIARMHTESLTRIFFDLCSLIYIWIQNGFASVTACGCCDSDCRVICYYFAYIYHRTNSGKTYPYLSLIIYAIRTRRKDKSPCSPFVVSEKSFIFAQS